MGHTWLLTLVLGLTALGLAVDGWQAARGWWQQQHRPTAVYRRALRNGVAVSLNALEKERGPGAQLPAMALQGVLVDRAHNDWVLFGEAAPQRGRLPVDALAAAFRALRVHLEDPGIDIRPAGEEHNGRDASQQVRYFGGVESTAVGEWFFRFDYWMKKVSLGEEPSPSPEIPAYWPRAQASLDQEVAACRTTGPARWVRRNRYWLCASDFTAIEDEYTLAFERTPLRVLAESVSGRGGFGAAEASSGTSHGTDDPLAAEFARQLTVHLDELTEVVPVSQIAEFSKVLAGLSWLLTADPYRDTSAWLRGDLARAGTPTSVPTLTRQAVRRHRMPEAGRVVVHEHSLRISGGVVISPGLSCARAGDGSLRSLYRVVLAARPTGQPVAWRFHYGPPSA